VFQIHTGDNIKPEPFPVKPFQRKNDLARTIGLPASSTSRKVLAEADPMTMVEHLLDTLGYLSFNAAIPLY